MAKPYPTQPNYAAAAGTERAFAPLTAGTDGLPTTDAAEALRSAYRRLALSLPTPAAESIFASQLPEWAELFVRKNRQYAGLQSGSLGVRGMFVDVWRKTHVLKRVLWDGGDSATEGIEEVVMDLIGHLFLILERLQRAELSDDEK